MIVNNGVIAANTIILCEKYGEKNDCIALVIKQNTYISMRYSAYLEWHENGIIQGSVACFR